MKDRISTEILENGAIRYAEYDANGNFIQNRYLLLNDAPTQEGTALNKANLLKDTTAALYGLTDEAVPDDVLGELYRFKSGIGNEYIWAKSHEDAIETESGNLRINTAGSTPANWSLSYSVCSYGKSISCSDGVLSLEETFTPAYAPTDTTENLNWWTNQCPFYVTQGGYFYYATSVITAQSSRVEFNAKRVVVGQTIDGYVNSSDPSAYPPSADDGYIYIPMGQLGAKARIETGSYIGTGTSGQSNPNSITFGFEPKLVIVGSTNWGLNIGDGGQAWQESFLWYTGTYSMNLTYTNQGVSKGTFSQQGNTLTWYADSIQKQCNVGTRTYYWLAIG